jgi:hypothetical protein
MQTQHPATPPRLSMIRRIARAFFPEKREKPRKGADKTVLLLAAMALSTIAGKAKSEDILVAPIETRVNKEINTSALTDCWINAIRQMYNWMYNGDRTGDTLARLYGKGGIAVLVIVSGNRIETNNLALAGTTGGNGKPLTPDEAGTDTSLSYWEAQDIYSTAVRAINRCGIAEVPLPNGQYFFIFDPERNDIPVIPAEN